MKQFYSTGGKLSEQLKNFYGSRITYHGIMKLLRKKDVKVNGVRVRTDADTKSGDYIEAYYDGDEVRLVEIYRDDDVLVCYKPVGITSEEFFENAAALYPSLGFIHRLDRNTDGLIVFSLSERAKEELLDAFRQRTFRKFYLAEVYGAPLKSEATLTAYLKKDEKRATVEIFPSPTKGAEKIITSYRTLKRGEQSSVLEVELVTGKTHQIRAHLAHIGNFIIGDGKYGKEEINRKFHEKYQRLTAYRLTFYFKEGSFLSYLNGKTFTADCGRLTPDKLGLN